MTLLIVEDSSLEMQRIRRMVLEVEPDAQLLSYTDSMGAKEQILQHHIQPDVAFLDIEMPPPTGIELAKLLIREYPQINIIFTTAYSAYLQQAFELFASGYLLKPFSTQDVRKQMQNLRHPVQTKPSVFFAKTIGEFDFFYQEKPVAFTLARSKEVLAYLIDRRGASVTKRELFSILFEDIEYNSGKQDHMKKILQALKTSLSQVGGEDLLLHTRNSYAIDMNKIVTDLPEEEKNSALPYMEQYSWADRIQQ